MPKQRIELAKTLMLDIGESLNSISSIPFSMLTENIDRFEFVKALSMWSSASYRIEMMFSGDELLPEVRRTIRNMQSCVNYIALIFFGLEHSIEDMYNTNSVNIKQLLKNIKE